MIRRVMVILALTLAAAACTQPAPDNGIASAQGAGPGPASAGPGADGVVDDPVKLAQCLREQGVPASDPSTPDGKPGIPETVTGEQIDAAMVHCRQYAGPNYGKEPAPLAPEQLELLRKFAQCMRDQGVDWEDPDPSTGRPKERDRAEPPTPARDRPQDQAHDPYLIVEAAKVCNEKVPGAGITVEGVGGPKGSDPTR